MILLRDANLLRVGCCDVLLAFTATEAELSKCTRQSEPANKRSHTLCREEGLDCSRMTGARTPRLLAALAVAASALGAKLGPAAQPGCSDPKSGIVCPSPDDPAVAFVALAVLAGGSGAFVDGKMVLQLQVRSRASR